MSVSIELDCTGLDCENGRREADAGPDSFDVKRLHELENGTKCWFLSTCIYAGHAGRWMPIMKKFGKWSPMNGCRVIMLYMPKDHPAREQEMNPHRIVRIAQ